MGAGMDVKALFDSMTVDETIEYIQFAVDFFEEYHMPIDRTPLEAPPVDMSWLITEDQVRAVRKPKTIRPCGHVQSATLLGLPCQACPEPPVPHPMMLHEPWENVPQPAEPKIDDLRVTIEPGIHLGVWFHIEKYYAKQKWNNVKCKYEDDINWFPVDKYLFGGHEHGMVDRWSRDENRAQERAAKFIGRQDERVAKYNARKDRIKNGTYTYNINPDR